MRKIIWAILGLIVIGYLGSLDMEAQKASEKIDAQVYEAGRLRGLGWPDSI